MSIVSNIILITCKILCLSVKYKTKHIYVCHFIFVSFFFCETRFQLLFLLKFSTMKSSIVVMPDHIKWRDGIATFCCWFWWLLFWVSLQKKNKVWTEMRMKMEMEWNKMLKIRDWEWEGAKNTVVMHRRVQHLLMSTHLNI